MNMGLTAGNDRPYAPPMTGQIKCYKISQNGENRYRIRYYYLGERIELYRDLNGTVLCSRQQAELLLNRIRSEIDSKSHDPNRYLPATKNLFLFSRQAELYLKDREIEAVKGILGKYQLNKIKFYFFKYFTPTYELMDIRDIKAWHIQRLMIDKLPQKWSPKTLWNVLAILKTFFVHAKRMGIISEVPAFPSIKVPTPVTKWISYEDQNRIIEKMLPHLKGIFYFMARQFVRPGEARALMVKDVDLNVGVITIERAFSMDELIQTRKNKKGYVVPIHPEVESILATAMRHKLPDAFLFSNKTGEFFTINVINKAWRKAAKAAGVNITCYQGTRHSCASQAANRGVPTQILSQALGHSDPRMVLRYSHLNPSTLASAFTTSENIKIEKGRHLKAVAGANRVQKKNDDSK